MKKKNGFTLVELLAVIIVLALILVIAIPSLLSTTASARKENFYLYAQNLSSKAQNLYINQVEEDPSLSECIVYDIGKDLGLPSTGDYEGWVKVSRTAVESGKKRATILFSPGEVIYDVKYCVDKGDSCTPNRSVKFKENSKEVKIVENIKSDEVLCANYYVNRDNVQTLGGSSCVDYSSSQAEAITDTYKYDVEVTLTDRAYAIQSYKMLESTDAIKSEFYKTIDKNKETPPLGDTDNPTKISSPRCSADEPITYKGLSEKEHTNVTTTTTTKPECNVNMDKIDKNYLIKFNTYGGTKIESIRHCTTCDGEDELPKPTRDGYTFAGWYYDSKYTNKVNGLFIKNVDVIENKDSGQCLVGYSDVTLYAKWDSNGTSTTTTKGTSAINPAITSSRDTTVVTTGSYTTTSRGYTDVTTTTKPVTPDLTDYSLLLDALDVSGYDIGFNSNTLYYNLNVPNTQESLNITYTAHEPESVDVSVEGADNLRVGINNVAVRVFNVYTNKSLVYRIKVKKYAVGEVYVPSEPGGSNVWIPEEGLPDPTIDESNAQLRSLIVSGYVIPFDPNVYDYDLEIKGGKELTVTYRTQSNGAIVILAGTDNVKDGSKITVKVQSQNGYYHKTYTINLKVNKPESTGTKILKIATIALGCAAVIMVIVTIVSKNGGLKFLNKTDKNENKNTKDNLVR